MKWRAVLEIDEYQYELLSFTYSFEKKTDIKGRPVSSMRGGTLYFKVESTAESNLLHILLRKKQNYLIGSVRMFKESGETIRNIQFEAYLFFVKESMQVYTYLPMITTFALSPQRLDINDSVRLDRRLPQTYGFGWHTYNSPEAVVARVEEQAEIKPLKVIPLVSGSPPLGIVNNSNIEMVVLIDDKGEEVTCPTLIKYVNLPAEQKFVNASSGVVTGTHQLDKGVWCKVRFKEAGRYTFTLHLESDYKTAYTATELRRNPNFKHKESRKFTMSTDTNNEVIIKGRDLFLSQVGGNTYTLKAECDGIVTCGTTILSKRMLFYMDIRMKGLTTCPNNLDLFKSEYSKNHIELTEVYHGTTVEYIKNIDPSNGTKFRQYIRKIVDVSNDTDIAGIKKYCIVIVFVDQLDQCLSTRVKLPFNTPNITNELGDVSVPIIVEDKINTSTEKSLWIDRDDTLDASGGWFVDCQYVDSNNVAHQIDEKYVKLKYPDIDKNPYHSKEVMIDFNNFLPNSKDSVALGEGNILLDVRVVNKGFNGISFSTLNIIYMRTRSLGSKRDELEQNETIMHEIGHQLGMVSPGQCPIGAEYEEKYKYSELYDIGLDKGLNYYDQYSVETSHKGCHCDFEDNVERCIMYGSGVAQRKSGFCPDCSSKVAKTDLTSGVPNLKR